MLFSLKDFTVQFLGFGLPKGFRARAGIDTHESGWPLEVVGDRDGAPMVLVPGDTFIQGRDDTDSNEAPAHKVVLGTYYIDRHEVIHHINAFVRSPESSYLAEFPTGKIFVPTVAERGKRRVNERVFDRRQLLLGYEPGYEPMPWLDRGAKLIKAGSDIVFEMHYNPNGKEVTDHSRPDTQKPQRTDRFMTGMLGLCLALTMGPLFLILGYLLYQGIGALNWEFFVRLPAPVGERGGGMANALVGSGLLVGLATLFAVPIGLLAAIYLAEYPRGRIAASVRFIGELLGGVPSIVIGIFAYTLVVVPMGHFSGWAGAFALGVIMLPIVMRASEEALKSVPPSLREASFALGANQWQTILRVTLPAALPAIITGVFLAIGRIAGETAPLLLTASSNQFWPTSPNDFTPSLPVYIFTYAVSPYPDWHRQAWAAALVLLVAVMLLNLGIRFLTGKSAYGVRRVD